MKKRFGQFLQFLHHPPGWPDFALLTLFAFYIIWDPYFLHGEIKLYEMGLYLPGINAVLNGATPYLDVFHLRGPLELYVPAMMMRLTGPQLATLNVYFYAGTALTIVFGILIARELFTSRLILIVFSLSYIARTWPRIFYSEWGGLRYALGLAGIWLALRFFKTRRRRWLAVSGLITATAALISVEIGVLLAVGVAAALIAQALRSPDQRRAALADAGIFAVAMTAAGAAVFLLMFSSGGLGMMWEAVSTVVLRMREVFDQNAIDQMPRGLLDAVVTMFRPGDENFRHVTPMYLYAILAVYLWRRWRQGAWQFREETLLCLGAYGFVMFYTAFRSVWGPQFEMALQPEKILYFYLVERGYFALLTWRRSMSRPPWRAAVAGVLTLMVAASLIHDVRRYCRRFYPLKALARAAAGEAPQGVRPMADQATRELAVARARGIVVPPALADEIERLAAKIEERTAPDEVVVFFPDDAVYNFLTDRPFLGKFPMVSLSWMNDAWHADMMQALRDAPPPWIVTPRELSPLKRKAYFSREENVVKYRDFMRVVEQRYALVDETPEYLIYRAD